MWFPARDIDRPVWSTAFSADGLHAGRQRTMRPPTACHFCRARRRKCQRSGSAGPCNLCRKHQVKCSQESDSPAGPKLGRDAAPDQDGDTEAYSPSLDGAPHLSPYVSQRESQPTWLSSDQTLASSTRGLTDVDQLELPPTPVCFHLASLYFDYVHDQLHSLFHKPSFMTDLAADRVPSVILYAVVALSARFSSHSYFAETDPRDRGLLYGRKSARLLDISTVSLTTVQAAVLLGAVHIIEGDATAESIYYGVACRVAQLLDLPRKVGMSALERELNVRLWHTLCMIDEWSSTGLRVSRAIPNHSFDVPLPGNEMTFLQMQRHDDIDMYPRTDTAGSLLAQMIILNRIFSDINRLNTEAAAKNTATPDLDAIKSLYARLQTWERDLPYYMRDDHTNLVRYSAQGLGRMFVAVYLGYYHFGQLLYYQFLYDSHQEHADGMQSVFARRCKHFAEQLCNMVYASHDTPGCDALYNMVGHVLVIASTVQIHTLLFSADEHEIRAARGRLERNFDILLKLRALWPSLDVCMLRLRVFHKACRTCMDSSFKLDRWMLKFLSEFANPVDDKELADSAGSDLTWILDDIAVSPASTGKLGLTA